MMLGPTMPEAETDLNSQPTATQPMQMQQPMQQTMQPQQHGGQMTPFRPGAVNSTAGSSHHQPPAGPRHVSPSPQPQQAPSPLHTRQRPMQQIPSIPAHPGYAVPQQQMPSASPNNLSNS